MWPLEKCMNYGLDQHKHNFSVWAAARAAQRGLRGGTVENLKDAIESCGLRAFLEDPASLDINKKDFRSYHQGWCRKIIARLAEKGISEASFGRAAKLVAVYIKSRIVIGKDATCPLAKIAHPPIDDVLLQNIARSEDIRSPHQSKWKSVRWTKLDEGQYYELVAQLSACLREDEPLWTLERYWTVIGD
jgi:hypothetical protein